MGCCMSTADASPYTTTQQGPNSSSRAITSSQPPSQANLQRPSTNASSHSNRPRGHHSQRLSVHINRTLKPHVWTCNTRQWTRTELDRERIEFFDTRVTGQPEIWQTIRLALDVLWQGGDAHSDDGGLGTAQQILDAAGVTLPTGDLASGVYDSLGGFYPLPEHIVADPTNLIPEPRREADDDGHKSGEGADSEELDEDEVIRRREEKGKAVVNPEDLIAVRARLSDGRPDLTITLRKDDSIRLATRRICDAASLTDPKKITIYYMGHKLEGNKSLEDYGFQEDHVLNVFVRGETVN